MTKLMQWSEVRVMITTFCRLLVKTIKNLCFLAAASDTQHSTRISKKFIAQHNFWAKKVNQWQNYILMGLNKLCEVYLQIEIKNLKAAKFRNNQTA